jgi:hypothetical protein
LIGSADGGLKYALTGQRGTAPRSGGVGAHVPPFPRHS